MNRIVSIALKDLRLAFRDSGALVMMLLTPFGLTLVIGFAFGGFGGGSSSGLADIPVVVANGDSGQFGQVFVSALQSPELADLLQTSVVADEVAARAAVDADEAAAAVIVPAGLSDGILPSSLLRGDYSAAGDRRQASVEVYANPGSPVSAGVVHAIVDQVAGGISRGVVGSQVAIEQMLANGIVAPQALATLAPGIAEEAATLGQREQLVTVTQQEIEAAAGEASTGFDWIAYSAPSMAIIFLMFTVTSAGRTILAERDAGTLSRMLVSPTTATQVLGGKVAGIFMVGLTQMSILILAGRLLLRIDYGPALAVVPLVLALVAAATAWGMLLAAWTRTPAQAGSMGAAMSLTFAALAGNFLPRQTLPSWLRTASLFTPNAWGLEGFTSLASGGGLADVASIIAALVVMAVVVFAVATLVFRRQYSW